MSPVGRLSLDRFCAHLQCSIKDHHPPSPSLGRAFSRERLASSRTPASGATVPAQSAMPNCVLLRGMLCRETENEILNVEPRRAEPIHIHPHHLTPVPPSAVFHAVAHPAVQAAEAPPRLGRHQHHPPPTQQPTEAGDDVQALSSHLSPSPWMTRPFGPLLCC